VKYPTALIEAYYFMHILWEHALIARNQLLRTLLSSDLGPLAISLGLNQAAKLSTGWIVIGLAVVQRVTSNCKA